MGNRKYPDMANLKVGNRVRFRNGGVSKVRVVQKDGGSSYYPIVVRLKNFHADMERPWTYDERGFCGEMTGRGHVCPFDIMEIMK